MLKNLAITLTVGLLAGCSGYENQYSQTVQHNFIQSCVRQCTPGAASSAQCQAYCQCGMDYTMQHYPYSTFAQLNIDIINQRHTVESEQFLNEILNACESHLSN